MNITVVWRSECLKSLVFVSEMQSCHGLQKIAYTYILLYLWTIYILLRINYLFSLQCTAMLNYWGKGLIILVLISLLYVLFCFVGDGVREVVNVNLFARTTTRGFDCDCRVEKWLKFVISLTRLNIALHNTVQPPDSTRDSVLLFLSSDQLHRIKSLKI